MKKLFILCCVLSASTRMMAQVPIINNVTPLTAYPESRIVITGSGFSSTPSDLLVSFDHVQGEITAASEFSIEVKVPPQARVANVEVLNKVSKFSAKSLLKFATAFNGTNFSETLFTTPLSFPGIGGEEVFDVCSCDFDGDGKPDIAASKNLNSTQSVMLLRNTSTPGTLSYTALPSLVVNAPTFNITCGDLYGDGKPDLVATRGVSNRNQVFLFRNASTGAGNISFGSPTTIVLDPTDIAFKPVIRDMNLDGKPDLTITNSFNKDVNPVYVFGNTSTGGNITFGTPSKIMITGANTTYGIEAQDLDGDLKPEIILNQFTAPDIFIVKNNSSVGELSFSTTIQKIVLAGSLNQMTTADFNTDGKLDIAVTSTQDDFLYVLNNQTSGGTISFGTPAKYSTGDLPWGVEASDIDGDKDIDLVVGNRGLTETTITVFKNSGGSNPTFDKVSITTGKKSRNLRVGDFDGDAKPDIAFTTDQSGNSLDIIRNKNCFSPVITNEQPVKICVGLGIRLTTIPSPGTTFTWREGTNVIKTGADPFADITATGNYTVTALSEGGTCTQQSAILTVTSSLGTLPQNPTINTVNPVCTGQTLNLTTPTVAGAIYHWSGPNSFTSTDQNPSIPNVTAAAAGIYTLQLEASTGCKTDVSSARGDIANMNNFFVSSSVASNSACQGSSVILSVNEAFNHSYQWIKGTTDIGGQNSKTLNVTEDGSYKVRVTNNTLGCSVEPDGVTVSIYTTPVSSFTASTLSTCINQTVSFTNQSTGDNRATLTYLWEFGDGTTSTDQNPTKIYTTAGNRDVKLTASYTGVSTCNNISTKTISAASPVVPVISATIDPICEGETSVLSVTGTYATYAWTGPATGSSATLEITKPGTYTLNVTESNGCASNAQKIITQKAGPILTVTADAKPVTAGGDLTVVANVPVQLLAAGADSYTWTPTTGLDNPAIANPILTAIEELSYTVTGAKSGQCNGLFTFNVKLDPNGVSFFPPNVFSPNGDGINDLWVVPGAQNYGDCTITIFNKQGAKVFEQKGYANTWDGTYEGKELPQGTYYYVLTCPSDKPLTGNVLIAR